jgi:anaerobic magnesium-protoporphyrin IX monomethyl ester cyclase
MNIVLINPPHTAIGSRVPDDHLPPLGLLALGGPLLDAGHRVRLVDAEFGPMPLATLVRDALRDHPDCILIGHSGSTSAHPTALAIARMIKDIEPATLVIYGGVFPTYHWRDILAATDAFDLIVRGEGEATIVALIETLERRLPLSPMSPASPIARIWAVPSPPDPQPPSPTLIIIVSGGSSSTIAATATGAASGP